MEFPEKTFFEPFTSVFLLELKGRANGGAHRIVRSHILRNILDTVVTGMYKSITQ